MLYQVLTRMIDRGTLDGLQDKIDVLYAVGRLTVEEYTQLTESIARG